MLSGHGTLLARRRAIRIQSYYYRERHGIGGRTRGFRFSREELWLPPPALLPTERIMDLLYEEWADVIQPRKRFGP
jgi:hypothetical protein